MFPRLLLVLLLITSAFLSSSAYSHQASVLYVDAGFSVPLQLSEPASTIVIGNQAIIATNTLKPDLLMINGQSTGATSMTIFGRSGKVYEYRVQVGNDVQQLSAMIRVLEKNVTVEDLNGIIVLKGTVPTPTALVRVLTVADRYVSGSATPPDFSVISDKGGVLTGNTDENEGGIEEEIFGVSPDPRISIPTLQFGGRGMGGTNGSGNNGSNGNAGRQGASGRNGIGSVAGALRQPLMPIKGNIAQNISRGEVVMVAGGKVMSLIQVAKQPKVEIQMQIVAVDRNKTDEFGIDWRLDGTSGNKNITIGSLTGGVSSNAVSTPGGTTPGSSDLFAMITNPGKYTLSTFLKFMQQKGAAKTLSSPLVTAISGESASFLVGGNVPIPVQTTVTGSGIAGTVAVATNVSFIQFGLKLLVRPTVLENGKISITLDQSISEPDYSQAITLLGAQIPGFNQRSVSTITESASGESWAVAGLLSEENSKNLDQVPWLSKVPVIGFLFQRKSDTRSRNELMILVNARVIDGDNNTTTSFDTKGDLAPASISQEIEADIPVDEQSLDARPTPASSMLNPVTPSNRKSPSKPASLKRKNNLSGTVDAQDTVVEWVNPDDQKSKILLINAMPPTPETLPQVIAAPKPATTPSAAMQSPRGKTPVPDDTSQPKSADHAEQGHFSDSSMQPETDTGHLVQAKQGLSPTEENFLNSPMFKMAAPNQFLVKPKPVPGRHYKPINNPNMSNNPLGSRM